jgi:hypothetical protein
MTTFRVWIRPLGGQCRVRVDGKQNAVWLLEQLGRSFVFKTAEPIRDDGSSSCCTFRVPYSPQVSRVLFERVLGGIPQVHLMSDPA